jgi:hypothetical protein
MIMLGDVLATARRSANGVERWLLADHPALHARISEAAAREGTSIGSFARMAVADYEKWADAEDWAALTSRLRACDNPGTACLLAMLEWRIAKSSESSAAPKRGSRNAR